MVVLWLLMNLTQAAPVMMFNSSGEIANEILTQAAKKNYYFSQLFSAFLYVFCGFTNTQLIQKFQSTAIRIYT